MDRLLEQIGIHIDLTREMIIIFLVLMRTMPMIFLTPFFGGKIAPSVVKMGLGAVISLLLWPIARDAISAPLPHTVVPIILLFLKEIFIGLALGFVNMEIFFVMEMAGRLVDTVRGSAMAEVLVPHTQTRATPFGDLYYQLMLVFFMALGGHNIFLEAYGYSFQLLPIDQSFIAQWQPGGFPEFVMRLTADVLLLAALLTLPIAAATLIADIVFGLLNRVAPQLNAYFMSMPVKAMGGIIMVFIVMEAFVARLHEFVIWSLKAAEQTIQLLSGQPLP